MNKKVLIIGGIIIAGAVIITGLYYACAGFGFFKGSSASAGMVKPAASVQQLLAQGDEQAALKEIAAILGKSPTSSQSESALFALASFYEAKGDLIKARDTYQKIVDSFPSSKRISSLQQALDNSNIKILFSSIQTPDSTYYEVQKGDSLVKIAKRFGTTVELITRANNLAGDTIRIGRRLKVSTAKFSISVDKSQNILTLKSGGRIVKTYRVSTGKNNSTPVGKFTITNKIVDPPWYTSSGEVVQPTDPKNILGTRWMGISVPSYGIHGTTEPQTIGKSVTAGCVRMRNAEVEELYAIVPAGTEVIIED